MNLQVLCSLYMMMCVDSLFGFARAAHVDVCICLFLSPQAAHVHSVARRRLQPRRSGLALRLLHPSAPGARLAASRGRTPPLRGDEAADQTGTHEELGAHPARTSGEIKQGWNMKT